MDSVTLKAMVSSKNEHWCTPGVIADGLYKMGPVLLDPCSNRNSIVKAQRRFYGPSDPNPHYSQDGLKESWQAGGLVYVNPPYGRKIGLWVNKAIKESREPNFLLSQTEIVMLVPARVDTKWFQELILPTANAVCLWRGRLKFEGAPSCALFPSALAYWGPNPQRFKLAFLGRGWMM